MKKKELKRACQWIISDDTGISSKVIWAVMMGVKPNNVSTPSDNSDFGRCYRLLKLMPEWEKRLNELKKVKYSYHLLNDNSWHRNLWTKFVDNYTKLCALWEETRKTKNYSILYNFMEEIF